LRERASEREIGGGESAREGGREGEGEGGRERENIEDETVHTHGGHVALSEVLRTYYFFFFQKRKKNHPDHRRVGAEILGAREGVELAFLVVFVDDSKRRGV
jgi:hypothetical protein